MDPKRGGNVAATRQGASKTSVASRHGMVPPTNMARKYGSEVSLTPSQAKQGVENPRKSPLDALSRMNYRQDPFQRRSGLQDVDDSFMAANAFARPSRLRHSGLEGNMSVASNQPATNAAVAPIRVASGQEAPQMQMQYQPQMQQQLQQQPPPQAAQIPQQAVSNLAPAQMPLQQQPLPAQQQQQLAPATVVTTQQSLPQQQQQPQYVQQPAAGQPTRHEPYPSGRAHVQHQHHQQQQQQQQQHQQQLQQQQQNPHEQQQLAQQDAQAQAQAQMQQQQQQMQMQQQQQQQQPPAQMSPRKYQQLQQQQQQQQSGYPSQATGAGGVPPAAEMCTTCPNCQTTIYLVRTPELGHGDAGLPLQ
ncbi:mediator of RNA polymerase II transcription subunit 15 isoform X2 [Drosophila novamexicana]|uniref:mediator of RNA polymerase II transcription subunit 15 isoform X2 n=1 Tax=Drosophila novamexicana TaxID=47314 RepID=UPI0011E5C346|nr:mediator of RNA polymerase II transcription subunit 15 isoform X2 [Drosophila novamexicana]